MSKKPGKFGNLLHKHRSSLRLTTERLKPSPGQLAAAHDIEKARCIITRMNTKDRCEHAEENIERLLALRRELCCVSGCRRKFIMWTPKGKFCGKHREEAIAAMRQAKAERYGKS